MTSLDPTTQTPLPPDAIQRILFICPSVHIYAIPPLTTTKGYTAAQWTLPTAPNAGKPIFTARLRILETAIPDPLNPEKESVKTDVLLEDPSNGQLFAAAPYRDAGAVEPVLDSSRFFAVRVVGEGGRKAVLGLGFEERSEAVDFGIALQEVRKLQSGDKVVAGGQPAGGNIRGKKTAPPVPEKKKDFSLKEGQTIHIDIGKGSGRRREGGGSSLSTSGLGSPMIAPPSGTALSFLPPPPSASEVKAERRRKEKSIEPEKGSVADLGFDDGEFGEFQ
ncbi:MAG: hypothetical protein MMC33_004765 [Icmadophila ericetorum]|nr:hypothetical protein [Icmadophila ericetorum]